MEKFKAHILVVDDDDGIRELVKEYLSQNEYLVTSSNSAEDALEATRLGYELKARNLVDLLRAERNFFDAQNRLSQAKYDFIIRSLEFKQATGSLKPQDIIDVNNFLD